MSASDWMAIVGILLVSGGLAMIYTPSAVIFFGVCLIVAGVVRGVARARPK